MNTKLLEKIEHEIMLPLIEALEKTLVMLRAVTLREQLEADGWIKHTGDVCPVHGLDEVLFMQSGDAPPISDISCAAQKLIWRRDGDITHYKVTKKYVKPKPVKKLVDWSCPLLKGCNTNCDELYVRLAPPATPTSNWQVYHQGETNLQTLHDAGFEIELKYAANGNLYLTNWRISRGSSFGLIVHYRVIGIREGFTDNAEEVL